MDILSIVGAALVAGAFALLGAWIQSTREHLKWRREKRYVAYLQYLQIGQEIIRYRADIADDRSEASAIDAEASDLMRRRADAATTQDTDLADALEHERGVLRRRLAVITERTEDRTERLKTLRHRRIEAATAFSLLGPKSVHAKARLFNGESEPGAELKALADVEESMRKVLKIDY